MFQEMKNNIESQAALKIKESLNAASYYWNKYISTSTFFVKDYYLAKYVEKSADALAKWGLKVRTGGDWDHKPKLDYMLDLDGNSWDKNDDDYFFPIRGDKKHEYYYDIWSNIHYGYVGSAIGFDCSTLKMEQI